MAHHQDEVKEIIVLFSPPQRRALAALHLVPEPVASSRLQMLDFELRRLLLLHEMMAPIQPEVQRGPFRFTTLGKELVLHLYQNAIKEMNERDTARLEEQAAVYADTVLVALHSGGGSMSEAADAAITIAVPRSMAQAVEEEFYRGQRADPRLRYTLNDMWLTQQGVEPVVQQTVEGYAQALLDCLLERYGDEEEE